MTIPQDFLDIDANTSHWTIHNDHVVPDTDALNDMTDAMMSDIPGQDDIVTPIKLHDQRFYKFAMAYLMQDGDLAVPGGRYGSSTSFCGEIAIVCTLIMQYHSGESITYYQLHHDMGLVVNSADDIQYMIREYAGLIGLDPSDYIDMDEDDGDSES